MDTVDVGIPIGADVAAAMMAGPKRAGIGRMVSEMLRPRPYPDRMIEVFERVSAEAARNGLTQKLIDEELAFAVSAGAVVSSDNDLLVLCPWRGIPTLRPAAYLAG